jgi:hypothetical protein
MHACKVHDFIPKQRISFALHARTTASTRWLWPVGVASHGLACPASCVLIPSLAFKKLACSKESLAFLLVGL